MGRLVLSKTCPVCKAIFKKDATTSIQRWLKRECCSNRCVALHRRADKHPQPFIRKDIESAIIRLSLSGFPDERIAEKLDVSVGLVAATRISAGV